jgi:crossover junction endodeoxyribonuclease RuvC
MKILGIDPGIGRMGYGVIKKEAGKEIFIAAGLIETPAGLPHADRLLLLAVQLEKILRRHKPDIAAIESLFFAKNAKTALAVAEARGVAILYCKKAGLAIEEHTPLQVKIALTGYGRAEKFQVAAMTKKLLEMPSELVQDDTLDALALCLTCAASRRT